LAETTEEYRTRINQLESNILAEPDIGEMRSDISEGVGKTGNRQADIETQFKDVINNTTGKDVISAPEIIAARSGEIDLKTYLDKEKQETTAQFAQKVGSGTKAELEDLSGNVLTAIEGGVGTSFNLLSIPQNKSVSPRKTTFISVGRNIVSTSELGVGFFDMPTGNVNPLASYRHTTNYIPVYDEAKLTYQQIGTGVIVVLFYDASFNYLSGQTNPSSVETGVFNIVENAHFFRVSFLNTKTSSIMLEYGTTKSIYEPYRTPKLDELLLPTYLINDNIKEKLVCFGDSITGLFLDPLRDYPNLISQSLSLDVYNVGFGGCRMSTHPSTALYDNFSMYRLADAIATGDFTLQDAAILNTAEEASHIRLDTLKSIDFNTIDYITIAYGTNDWSGGTGVRPPIDNPENLYDITTFNGAARYSVKRIHETYPHLKIMFITPFYQWDITTGLDSEGGWRPTYNPNYSKLDYINALIKVGNEEKIPVIDMYRTLGINKYNREFYIPSTDGTHPNEKGMALIADRAVGELVRHFNVKVEP